MGVERYMARYRAAYTLYRARLHGGETSTSHRVQGDLYYGLLSSSAGVSVLSHSSGRTAVTEGTTLPIARRQTNQRL